MCGVELGREGRRERDREREREREKERKERREKKRMREGERKRHPMHTLGPVSARTFLSPYLRRLSSAQVCAHAYNQVQDR